MFRRLASPSTTIDRGRNRLVARDIQQDYYNVITTIFTVGLLGQSYDLDWQEYIKAAGANDYSYRPRALAWVRARMICWNLDPGLMRYIHYDTIWNPC